MLAIHKLKQAINVNQLDQIITTDSDELIKEARNSGILA